MVHPVDRSFGNIERYRRLNGELAKENNDLKEQLAQAIRLNNYMSEGLLEKNEKISQLENRLRTISRKAIEDLSPRNPRKKSRSTMRHNKSSRNQTTFSLECISEESSSSSTICNDSLDPPEVTSVPPIENIGRVVHTPSVWHCLDSIEDKTNHSDQTNSESSMVSHNSSGKQGLRESTSFNLASPIQLIGRKDNHDMFQSTPVQIRTHKVADNQENLVKLKISEKKKEEESQQAKRETDDPPRYNLRKRTRVCY